MHSYSSDSDCTTSCPDIISPRIQVNPHPVSNLLNIVFDNYEETEALDYEVADKTGKVLLHGHWPVNKGLNKTVVNLSLLGNGTHWLSIVDKSSDDILVRQRVAGN